MTMKKTIALILALLPLALAAEPALKPLAFYMKNLPCPRIGTQTDGQIRASLEADGFIVIDLDCSSFPKTSPELEDALCAFHKNAKNVYSAYENASQAVDASAVFYVPAGYTVTRNIPVWNIAEHGAEGSVQRVVETWNKEIVEMFGVAPVTSADQMYYKDGSPVDWWLRMDIVHPAGTSATKVPTLLIFSSNSPRLSPISPLNTSDQAIWKCVFPLGFMASGYAFAIADHCYNPLARTETWKYFDRFTLDDWDGLASTTAYVRYLKSHLQEYNLNGKIGVMGISKASYSAVRIADTENASLAEYSLFNGTPNSKPQPWQGVDSRVDVAYAAAGNGTRRAGKYVTETSVPMITSAGRSDEYGHWSVYPDVIKRMNDIDHIHLDFWMEELGHTYPGMGNDVATGERRYVLFKRFFDHYLKPDPQTSADVFLILPKENSATVDVMGQSRALPPDNYLPTSLLGLPKTAPITVRFLEEYATDEVASKVSVVSRADNTPIEGEWTASMQGTCFSFAPSAPLVRDGEYEIIVPVTLTSKAGRHPSKAAGRLFKVTLGTDQNAEAEGSLAEKLAPAGDSYSSMTKNKKIMGSDPTMRMRYSQYAEYRFDSYLKFDISRVDPAGVAKVKLFLALSAPISGNVRIDFYKTGSSWDEATLTNDNRPDYASAPFDAPTIGAETSWIEVDATPAFMEAVQAGEKTLGIAGRIPNTEDSNINVWVHSKEAADEGLRPYLAIYRKEYGGPATIDVARQQTAGQPVKLAVKTAYEQLGVEWYLDGVRCSGDTVSPTAGRHKLKAVVDGGENVGREIIVKYIQVR